MSGFEAAKAVLTGLLGNHRDRGLPVRKGLRTFHLIRYSTTGRLYSFMTTLRPSISSTSATSPSEMTSTAGVAAHETSLRNCFPDTCMCALLLAAFALCDKSARASKVLAA